MKLKKILASLTAAALAVTTMAFAPVSVSAADYVDVQLNVSGDFCSAVVINTNGDYKIADKAVTVSGYWGQINRQDESKADTEYAPAFGSSTVEDSTQSFSFSADASLDTVKLVVVSWSNAEEKNVGYESTIDLSKAVDNKLVVQFAPDGEVSSELTNYWYYLQNVKVNYLNASTDPIVYNEWIKQDDGTYKYNCAAKTADDTDEWNGTAKYLTGVSFDEYLPAGATYADIRKINVSVTAKGGNCGGSFGTNAIKEDGTSDWKQFEGYSIDGTVCTLETPYGIPDDSTLQVGVDWINYNTKVTVKIEVVAEIPTTTEIAPKVTVDATYKAVNGTKEADIKAAVLKTAKITNLGDVVLDSADYTLTASDVTNGKVTVTFELTEAGKEKYTLAETSVTSASCEIVTLYAVTVSSSDEAMGTAAPDKDYAAEGETVTLTRKANTGYKFVKWEGVTVEDDNTFTMPAKDVAVTAVFDVKPADEFDITVIAPENGKLAVKGGLSTSVKGKTIELTATPAEGYELDTISVNGKAIEGTSFTMPEEDVTVTAVFKKTVYNIEVDITSGGDASVNKTEANMGDVITITATPDKGYEVEKITVNGEAIEGTTFTMPAKNVIVSVSFKKLPGNADAEIEVIEGIEVGFAGSKEDVLAAVLGDKYKTLVEEGSEVDVVVTVNDKEAVADSDIKAIEDVLADNQKIGLVFDITMYYTVDGVSYAVTETVKPVSFKITVPDSIIADGNTYFVVRVHDGESANLGGTFDSESKTITFESDKFSSFAIVYAEPQPEPEPEEPVVVYYRVVSDSHSMANTSAATAGTAVSVRTDFGYVAEVYCGSTKLAAISDRGTFVMPAGNVRIVSVADDSLAAMKKALPNSYIFVYDSDMNYIKTNGTTRGISVEGRITVKLGEEYAGKTITLYKGRKNTSVEVASKTLNEDGNATFTVSAGMNYTAVVE